MVVYVVYYLRVKLQMIRVHPLLPQDLFHPLKMMNVKYYTKV